MGVKIKVSYERDQELEAVKRLLAPVLLNVKVQPAKGKYKRAYILVRSGENFNKIE